ncbi:MAG TPA: lysophospholipid acyltransferase family protein [Candidatus Udaeobacter sp.]|nr:lysophospholipid acyltransferase family protein [Candidatus Udaeobacter sp.]
MGSRKEVGENVAQEKLKIEGWLARWLIAFGVCLLRVWERTLRYDVEDRAGIVGKPVTENYIGALWHNRLLIFPLVLRLFFPNRRGAALISASRDGDLLTDAIRRFGYAVIRGSSSRLGASAILQLTEELASGRDVVITPDGPRGPVYELGPGIIFLAQKSGASVLPMSLEYSRYWRLGSWDRFIIPQPFSKVRVFISRPHHVNPTGTPEEFEAQRLLVQDVMMSMVEMR